MFPSPFKLARYSLGRREYIALRSPCFVQAQCIHPCMLAQRNKAVLCLKRRFAPVGSGKNVVFLTSREVSTQLEWRYQVICCISEVR